MIGTTYKRCACRDANNRELGSSCPDLFRKGGSYNPRHGSWTFAYETHPDSTGETIRLRFGGYDSQDAAEATLTHINTLMAIPRKGPRGAEARAQIAELIRTNLKSGRDLPNLDTLTAKYKVGQPLEDGSILEPLLNTWIDTVQNLTKNGKAVYEVHTRLYLVPHLGDIEYDHLRTTDIAAMFKAIDEFNLRLAIVRATGTAEERAEFRYRKHVGPTTKIRIKACLSSFLTGMVNEGLLTINVAKLFRLPNSKVKPLVWNDPRVERWQKTRARIARLELARNAALENGDHTRARELINDIDQLKAAEKPSPVMVWTLAQTGQFLDRATEHWLYALFHLVAFTGLRRGEACGLRWEDVDLDRKIITINQQLVQVGWEVEIGDPKTEGSTGRTLALDDNSVAILRMQKKWQRAAEATLGDLWQDTDLVFCRHDGSALRPSWVSTEFKRVVAAADLPPIRFHDLRHGAASIAFAAGATEFAIQEMLGHDDIRTTRMYTSIFREMTHHFAEASAAIIPRTITLTDEHIHAWMQSPIEAMPGGKRVTVRTRDAAGVLVNA